MQNIWNDLRLGQKMQRQKKNTLMQNQTKCKSFASYLLRFAQSNHQRHRFVFPIFPPTCSQCG